MTVTDRARFDEARPLVGVQGPPYCPCPICGDQVWDLALLPRDAIVVPPHHPVVYLPPRNVWHAHRCGHAWTGGGDINFDHLVYSWYSDVVETNPIALYEERAETWRRISWT